MIEYFTFFMVNEVWNFVSLQVRLVEGWRSAADKSYSLTENGMIMIAQRRWDTYARGVVSIAMLSNWLEIDT